MYGYPKLTSIDLVRTTMLKKMVGVDEKLTSDSKIDLSRLPPCRDCLIPHIQRVNLRLASFKRANLAFYGSPKPYDTEQGWQKCENGILEPVWSSGAVLPSSLVDIVDDIQQQSEEDDVIIQFEEVDFNDE